MRIVSASKIIKVFAKCSLINQIKFDKLSDASVWLVLNWTIRYRLMYKVYGFRCFSKRYLGWHCIVKFTNNFSIVNYIVLRFFLSFLQFL